MNRTDIVNRIAEKGYTKKAAEVILDDLVLVITEALSKGEEVKLHGFGTFSVRTVEDRESVNVRTQERFVVHGRKIPRFTPGVSLKRAVREGIVRE